MEIERQNESLRKIIVAHRARIEDLTAENIRMRDALRGLAMEAETFAIVARYQGTPLTALEQAIERAREAAPVSAS
jgi:hypothetical protein